MEITLRLQIIPNVHIRTKIVVIAMGCTYSSPVDENDVHYHDKRINDAIEHGLNLRRANEKDKIKLLLLGAGESGKSTVLKQLKLFHKGGFTQQERLQYSQIIWADVIQSMKILIVQARKLKISLDYDKDGSPLMNCKHIVLQANALGQIDTGVAGGVNFLSDYVLKYGERHYYKRKIRSTGLALGMVGVGINSLEDHQDEVLDDVNVPLLGGDQQYSRREIADAIKRLWEEDRGIRRCFDRSNEFQLETSVVYYFNNIDNFADPQYHCNDTDILNGRVKTTGITETEFVINSFKFQVLDAGGQRLERKKWINCFENVTAILFVVAVSEYDQVLFEDERVNRMREAIVLYDTLCNSQWFANTPFIFFMNKIDIFKTKITKSPIKRYFPDYNGPPDSYEDGLKYFERIFLSLNRSKRPIYLHRTCATDTKSMKFVLSAVTDMIVQQNLKKSGML